MAVCPNCAKKLRDGFVYCRVCGTKLSGENPGDFTTEMLNVFNHEDGFVYLFSDKGNQVVLNAGSIEELAFMAHENNYPWEFRDKSRNSTKKVELVKTPQFETDFLRASSLQKPEVIPTSSTFKKAETEKSESYVPDFEVSRVVDDSSMPKKNNGPSNEFGIRKSFGSERFLKGRSRLARQNRRKTPKSEEFWQKKSQMTREYYQKRTDEINERLTSHNMDKLLR